MLRLSPRFRPGYELAGPPKAVVHLTAVLLGPLRKNDAQVGGIATAAQASVTSWRPSKAHRPGYRAVAAAPDFPAA